MKKIYFSLIFFFSLSLIIGSFFYIQKSSVNDVKITTLQKNISWGTDFENNIPYKKGDNLELNFIIEGNGFYRVNIKDLESNFDIKNISINGEISNIEAINNLKITKEKPVIIKLEVISKNNKTNLNEDELNIEQVSEIDNPKEEEIVKKIEGIPSNITLGQINFNSNINNLLTIKGTNLDSIQFIMIGEKAFKPIIEDNIAYITINKSIFGTGDYFIMINTFDGQIIPINSKLHFDYSKNNINIAFITPRIIDNNTEKYVILQGNGFKKLISLQLSNNIVLKNTAFQIINDNVLSVKIPKDIPAGNYNFNLMDTSGIYEEAKILRIIE
ncbi:MAG: hypothetical protein PHZ26_02015 [Candidatus Gracilibacteria bacterium]|nr:hypothetical protein [Candidatus Gracilibacteria bacterium]MDD2908510.1 hypothetical protein [Candidatus Gracilibacteria bacterium]